MGISSESLLPGLANSENIKFSEFKVVRFIICLSAFFLFLSQVQKIYDLVVFISFIFPSFLSSFTLRVQGCQIYHLLVSSLCPSLPPLSLCLFFSFWGRGGWFR